MNNKIFEYTMIRPDSLNNQLKLLFGTNKLFKTKKQKKSYQKTDISYLIH